MDPSSKTLVDTIEHLVRECFQDEGTGHDWWHIDRVRKVAMRIGTAESADLVTVELGALLHDIADWKFHAGDEQAGPREATRLLTELNADPGLIANVTAIVEGVTFRGAGVPDQPLSLEGRCVQDADRLDAIGAIGIARAFAYGGAKGRPLHDPNSPPVSHQSFAAYQRNTGATLNHFYEKLLLLRDRMTTKTGRALADKRHRYLEGFVEQFLSEWASEA